MMRLTALRMLFIAAITVGVGSLLLPASANAAPLKSLLLARTDLPSGFRLVNGHTVNASRMASDFGFTAAAYRKHGGEDGYRTAYSRTGTTGLLKIVDGISPFKTVSGARWLYARVVAQIRFASGTAPLKPVSNLGEQSTEVVTSYKYAGVSYSTGVIVFRRQAYVSVISATGITNTFSVQQVIQLAKKVDTRIVRQPVSEQP